MKEFVGLVVDKPKNWEELEDIVYRFLKLINVTTQKHKKLINTKGVKHETDVYFEEYPIANNQYLFNVMVECKHYKQKISQDKVSSFINFCKELAAARGIMIVTSQFQSGCHKLVTDSAVLLLTLEQFIEMFFTNWFYKCSMHIFNKIAEFQDLYTMIKDKDFYPDYNFENEMLLLAHLSLIKDSTDSLRTIFFFSKEIEKEKLILRIFSNDNLKKGEVNFNPEVTLCETILEYFEKCNELILDTDNFIKEKISVSKYLNSRK